MEAVLFLIHPNDLETLILEAESPQDVLDSAFMRQSLYLGTAWETLNQALHPAEQPALEFAIQAEHPLSERLRHPEAVR